MIDREQERPATLPYEYRRVGGWSGTAPARRTAAGKERKKAPRRRFGHCRAEHCLCCGTAAGTAAAHCRR